MIDLRSDTLTLPTPGMLKAILVADLGDDGRLCENGRGEDPTVRELEDYAAEITQKEASCFVPTGTFGNSVAILTICRPGDKVLVDDTLHIYQTENFVFNPRFGQLTPIIYKLNSHGTPDYENIKSLIENIKDIRMLCVENTHNSAGGVAIPLNEMKALYELTREKGIYLHMDGARIFNAALALNISVSELAKYADSLMFCLSKGLGAPIGSMVCGNKEFITKLRANRRIMGAGMRQAGVVAAPGLYALKHQINRLKEDHENARTFAQIVMQARKIKINPATVQSNIILMDISAFNMGVGNIIAALAERGIKCSEVDDCHIRAVFYLGITSKDAIQAGNIICEYFK